MRVSTSSSLRGVIALTGVFFITCGAAAQQPTKAHGEYSGDLVGALEFISTTFHLPIIAELTKSYPAHVSISAGDNTAEQLLNALSGQLSGYTRANRGGVALFYDKRVRDAPANFFNGKIARFVMPADLAQLKLELNQAMGAHPGTARVMVGVPEEGLGTVKLRKGEVLSDTTGLEVLVEAAKQSKNLFSVVLFPTANPKTAEDVNQAHMNWYVRSIDELSKNPTRLRSIPQPKAPGR